MTVFADQLISGSGQVNFGGGQRINYVLVHVRVAGPEVRPLEASDPDHFMRAGWFALGNDASIDDGVSRTYWTAPKYVNFATTQWHPEPTVQTPPVDFAVWASRIRWSLSLGTTAWLFVFGV